MEKRSFDSRIRVVQESKTTAVSQADLHRMQQLLLQQAKSTSADKEAAEARMYDLQQKLGLAQSENNHLIQQNASLQMNLKKLDSISKEVLERSETCSMCQVLEQQRQSTDANASTSEAVKNTILELERKHRREISKMEKTYQERLEYREGELEGEKKRLQKQLTRANASKEQNENRQAIAISKTNEAIIQRLRADAVTDQQLIVKHEDTIGVLRAQLEAMQSEHMSSAKRTKDAEQRVAELRLRQTAIEKAKTAAETEHAHQLTEMRKAHQAEQAKLEEQTKAKVDACASRYTQQADAARKTYEERLKGLQRQIASLNEQITSEKQVHTSDTAVWKAQMQAEEKKRAMLLEQATREQQQLKQEYTKQVEEMSAAHEEEIANLKQQLQQALSALESTQQAQALVVELRVANEKATKLLAISEQKFLNEEALHRESCMRNREELNTLTSMYEEKVKNLQEERKNEVVVLQKELEMMKNSLSVETQKLEECVRQFEMKTKGTEALHQEQLHIQKTAFEQTFEKKLEEMQSEFNRQKTRNEEAEKQLEVYVKDNQMKFEQAKQEYEKCVLEMQASSEVSTNELTRQHQQLLQEKENGYANKINLIEMQSTIRLEKLSASHASNLQTLSMQHEQKTIELKVAHEAMAKSTQQIEALHKEHEDMKEKEIAMTKKLGDLQSGYTEEMETLTQTLEKEKIEKISKLQALQSIEVNKLTKVYELKITEIQSVHNEEMCSLQEIHKEQKEQEEQLVMKKYEEYEKKCEDFQKGLVRCEEILTASATSELTQMKQNYETQIQELSSVLTRSKEREEIQLKEIETYKLKIEEKEQNINLLEKEKEEIITLNKQRLESEKKKHENILALIQNETEMEKETLCKEAQQEIENIKNTLSLSQADVAKIQKMYEETYTQFLSLQEKYQNLEIQTEQQRQHFLLLQQQQNDDFDKHKQNLFEKYKKEQEEIGLKFEQKFCMLEIEKQQQLTQLQGEKQHEINMLEEKKEKEFLVLQQKQKEEISLLKQEKEREISQFHSTKKEEISSLKQEKEQEIFSLKQTQTEELFLLQQQLKQGKKEISHLQQEKAQEISLLLQQKEQEISQLQQVQKAEISQLQQKQQEISQLHQEQEREIFLLKQQKQEIFSSKQEKELEISHLQQEFSYFKQEKEEEFSRVVEEKEKQSLNMQETKEKELKIFEEETNKKIEEMMNEKNNSMQTELEKIISTHTQSLSLTQEKHSTLVESLHLQLSEAEKKYSMLELSSSQQHTEMQKCLDILQQENERKVFELVNEKENRFKQMEKENDEKMRNLMSAKDIEEEKSMKEVKERYEQCLVSLKEQHAKDISALHSQHTVEKESISLLLHTEIETKFNISFQHLQDKCVALESQIEENKERHQEELVQSREEYNETLSSIKEKHETELQQTSRAHHQQLQETKQQLSSLQEEYELTKIQVVEAQAEVKEMSECLVASKEQSVKAEPDNAQKKAAKAFENEVTALKNKHAVELKKLEHKVKMEAHKDNDVVCKQAVETAEAALEDRLRREFNRELEKVKKDHTKQSELQAKKLESALVRRPLQEVNTVAFQPNAPNTVDDAKLDMMVQEANQQNKALQLRRTENPGTFLLGVRRLHLSVVGGVLSVRIGGGFITFPEFVKKYGKDEGQRIFDNASDENAEWASVACSKYGLDENKPEQEDDKLKKARKSLALEPSKPASAMKERASKLRRRSNAQF